MNHDHSQHDIHPKAFWRSRYAVGLLVLGAIALYFLLTEHRAHFFSALPLLLLLACGVDTAIEAVGIPATFELCQQIVAAGGTIANIGVHGKPASLHLETLWDRNIAITTRLVDTATIPMLFKTAAAKTIDPALLIPHRFTLAEGEAAYETFGNAAKTRALKVIISPS
jgi:threonine dehydrogenase-like Zn-dependent dehydrogenase